VNDPSFINILFAAARHVTQRVEHATERKKEQSNAVKRYKKQYGTSLLAVKYKCVPGMFIT
jgi:hypothetical protein